MLKIYNRKTWVFLTMLLVFTIVIPMIYSSIIAISTLIIKVNDNIFIVDNGEYNESHGVSGVSYDSLTETLTLTNVNIENIYCNSNLKIKLEGTNVINNIDGFRAIEARGNINITGDEGILNISTNDVAIEIGAGCRLTIGDEVNLDQHITVNLENGRNINTTDTYIVEGSTYNLPADEEEPGPEADSKPFKLYIDDVLVIDETAEPKIEAGEGTGYTVDTIGFMPGYIINVDTSIISSIGSIETEGNAMLILSPDGNLTVEANELGYSVDCKDQTEFFTGAGGEEFKITFNGSIRTLGSVFLGDKSVDLGSVASPLSKGIECSELNSSFNSVRIYSTNYAFENIENISVSKKSTLEVYSNATATNNVGTIQVYEGGKVDIYHNTGLGTFASKAGHWPWKEMLGTEEDTEVGDFPTPTFVNCIEGTHLDDKYSMNITEGHFALESKGKAMYALSSNIQNGDTIAADSLVANGRVRVIAAYGYKQVAPDYIDYVIEEGSTVTIELLPDYGYQYVSGGLNGVPTSPDTGKATYTFIMPSNNIHLSAIFEKTEDIINLNSKAIKGASIVLPEGEINGNAQFNVITKNMKDTKNFEKVAGDKELGAFLDLTLNEYILKGNGSDDAWTESIKSLSKDMTVSLQLSENLKGKNEYSIIREHDGKVEIIPSTYDSKTNTITFKTNKYSTYAISYDQDIVEQDNLVGNDSSDSTIVNTGDTKIFVAISLICIILVCNIIITIRIKKAKSKV